MSTGLGEDQNVIHKREYSMKHEIIKMALILSALMGITACQSNSEGLSTEDRKTIENASKTWVNTYNQNDWTALTLLFSTNATMMPPNSPIVVGREAIAAWQNENESGFRISFDIQEIDGNGDIAHVMGRSCVFIPDGNGGFLVDVGKFLEIRKKHGDDSEWLIHADIFNSDTVLGGTLPQSCPFAAKP
jgi:ketosteroid isomerase-like protein